MKPTVSIIIPCYNDDQYIEQAVLSALAQTHPYKEIIVIDDGSNSETKAILKKIEPKITTLITQENKGQSAARNVGIKEAKGDYILALDSDDFFEPTFCEKAIAVFVEKENIKLVTCYANLLYNDDTQEIYEPKGGDVFDFMFVNCALGTSMFKRKDWQNCGCYDEYMRSGLEDWEFFIRLLKTGGQAFVLKEPLYNYRKRSNSTTKTANKKKNKLLYYIYIKHKELYMSDYDNFVTHLLSRIEKEEFENDKNEQRLEFKIGKFILNPFRWFKKMLK